MGLMVEGLMVDGFSINYQLSTFNHQLQALTLNVER